MSQTSFGPNDAITEGCTARYACAFHDLTGNTITGAAVTTITASLYDHTGTVINARSNQSVLNTNGGTWANGTFALVLSPTDTVAVGSKALQPRSLVLRVGYDSGSLVHEVHFFIKQATGVA